MVIVEDFFIQIRIISLVIFYHIGKNESSLILLSLLILFCCLNCLKSDGLTLLNLAMLVTISFVRYGLEVLVFE